MKFSVVIPTYNRRHQIGDAIDSALSEAHDGIDVEVIVVDDRSSDGTIEWLHDAYADRPVTILHNDRSKGPAGARNTGIIAARSDFIALLDSDDRFLPGHLASVADVFARHPEAGLVFGRARYEQDGREVDYMGPNFDRKLEKAPRSVENEAFIIFSRDFFSHLLEYGCYFNLSTVVLRTSHACALMNESLRIAEDFEFWVRLARQTTFACLKAPQIRYQLHDSNISFEASTSAADHTPFVISAYEQILAYPKLGAADRNIVRRHIAQALFDWGYRCRVHGQLCEAAALHLRSARVGLRKRNLFALLKLAAHGLRPSRRA